MTKTSHHAWKIHLKLIGHSMPLIRILLILRKFRVGVEAIYCDRIDDNHWEGSLLLDFQLSTRIETVFKKVARLYDVAELSYAQEVSKASKIKLK